MQSQKQLRNLVLSIVLRSAAAVFAIAVVLTVALTQFVQAQMFTEGGNRPEKVLHNFGNDTDGVSPSGLIFDSFGNLYGTTASGGISGLGTAFELTPDGHGGWSENVLHNFGGPDGAEPSSGLIFDFAGNLYGTTLAGWDSNIGTIFKLTPKADGEWAENVLYNFNGDGYMPSSTLISDAAGNLYGTTQGGGEGEYPYGTVFELTLSPNPVRGGWRAKVLHGFNGADGSQPWLGSLIFDRAGDLYGTTNRGGTYGAGVVFELMPTADGSWTETVLHSFSQDGTDGILPFAGVVFDAAGNLYGTTWVGGSNDAGTVFKLTPSQNENWTETVLHSFGSGTDGANPAAGLIFDAAGDLYGTTGAGGDFGYGTVFEFVPNGDRGWTEQILYSFRNSPDGNDPNTPLVMDKTGNIYGSTGTGGTYGKGTTYEIIRDHTGGNIR